MPVARELRRRLQSDRSSSRFEPCLPRPVQHPLAGPGWIHEIKHDGFRILAHRRGRSVRLVTRNGYDFADRFPLVTAAIEELPVKSCIIDGEAIVCDDSGLAVFDLIRGHATNAGAILCAFDLLEVNGEDIRREPIEDRKRRLAGLLRLPHDGIALQRAIQRRRRDDLQARLRARLRGHCVQTTWVVIPRRPIGALAQDQEPGRAGGAASRRRRLDLMVDRRFPPRWTFEEANGACLVVKDANGFAVSYVYFESDPGRRTAAALMTKDEARRIAANIAKLPDYSAPTRSRTQMRFFTEDNEATRGQ